jgi:O-acetyl-ADP-ribose deacetylase (regulator of RNase III)
MTIKWVPEMSIFDHPSNVALVNPVNCAGVMGAGLAKEFKRRFPEMYNVYKDMCAHRELFIGSWLRIWHSSFGENMRVIVMFPTKINWRNSSKLEYIDAGLRSVCPAFETCVELYDCAGVALPKLGCGLGGLAWPDVRALMIEYLEPLDVLCYVHGEAPDA